MALGLRLGIGIGCGSRRSRARSFALQSISGIQQLFIPHKDEYSSITMLGEDTTGGSKALRSASGYNDTGFSYRPTFNAALNGMPAILVSGTGSGQHLTSDSSTAGNHLHSGEYTIGMMAEFPAIGGSNSNSQICLATRSVAAPVGGHLLCRGSLSGLRWREHNGTSFVLDVYKDGVLTAGWHAVFIRVSRSGATPHARIFLDGVQLAATGGTYSGTSAVGNSGIPFTIGKLGTETGEVPGNINLGWLGTWGRALTDDEIATATANMLLVKSARTVRRVVWTGDSMVEYTDNFRRRIHELSRQTTGMLLVPYGDFSSTLTDFPMVNVLHDGKGGQTLPEITARIAGHTGRPGVTDLICAGGTNSLGADIADQETYARAMLAAANANSIYDGAQKILVGVPYGNGSDAPATTYQPEGKAGAYNAMVASIAAEYGFTFVDLHDPTPLVGQDALGHPNEAMGITWGDRVWAAAFAA